MENKGPISRRLKSLVEDHLTARSTVRAIEEYFEGPGIQPQPAPQGTNLGLRRHTVQNYYRGLNWEAPGDIRKFLEALRHILLDADSSYKMEMDARYPPWSNNSAADKPPHPLAKMLEEIRRCGYEWTGEEVLAASASARLADAKAFAEEFELGHLGEHIQRIERAIDDDPGQAIGSAKELAETVAKTILNKRNVPFTSSSDLLELGKLVFKALKQLPDDVPEKAKGAEVIKRMLSNLGSVVQGIAEVRGLYGTGHGKDGKAKGLAPRHARLVVGTAAALAYYWVETERETP